MLTRAGRGHDGDDLGSGLHRSVRRLGGGGVVTTSSRGGARSSARLGAGAVVTSSSRGGARGGGRLGASRVSGRASRASRGGAGGGRPRRVALALLAPFLSRRVRVDGLNTTSLHDTSEGRARKGEESQSFDHFERLKGVFLCLIRKDLRNSNE